MSFLDETQTDIALYRGERSDRFKNVCEQITSLAVTDCTVDM